MIPPDLPLRRKARVKCLLPPWTYHKDWITTLNSKPEKLPHELLKLHKLPTWTCEFVRFPTLSNSNQVLMPHRRHVILVGPTTCRSQPWTHQNCASLYLPHRRIASHYHPRQAYGLANSLVYCEINLDLAPTPSLTIAAPPPRSSVWWLEKPPLHPSLTSPPTLSFNPDGAHFTESSNQWSLLHLPSHPTHYRIMFPRATTVSHHLAEWCAEAVFTPLGWHAMCGSRSVVSLSDGCSARMVSCGATTPRPPMWCDIQVARSSITTMMTMTCTMR